MESKKTKKKNRIFTKCGNLTYVAPLNPEYIIIRLEIPIEEAEVTFLSHFFHLERKEVSCWQMTKR